MRQMLLFPDPRPLVERLGSDYFRQLPDCPGVYLMRDSHDVALYVGKALNLRKRLCSYRVANPERLGRRHLRLLRAVARIELIQCADEAAALAKESELLRALKPRFNRVGTWPVKEQIFLWRHAEDRLELAVSESREAGWECRSLFGGGAGFLLAALARLLWRALHPELDAGRLPAGWLRGRLRHSVSIRCGPEIEQVRGLLAEYFGGEPEGLCAWVQSRVGLDAHAVYGAVMESDLEAVMQYNFRT